MEGTEVKVTGGAHKNRIGTVISRTPKRVRLRIQRNSGEEIEASVNMTNIAIMSDEEQEEEEEEEEEVEVREEESEEDDVYVADLPPRTTSSTSNNNNETAASAATARRRRRSSSIATGTMVVPRTPSRSLLDEHKKEVPGLSGLPELGLLTFAKFWGAAIAKKCRGFGTLILKIPIILSSNAILVLRSATEFAVVFAALFLSYITVKMALSFIWNATGLGEIMYHYFGNFMDAALEQLGTTADRLTTIADLGAFPLGWMAIREQYNFDQYWVTSYYKFERVNCSLNFFIREDDERHLRFRTLFETLPQDFLNKDLLDVLSEAQTQTTTEDPFVDMNQDTDKHFQEAFNKQLVNYISALAATRWIDIAFTSSKVSHEKGYKFTPPIDLIFGLTYEVDPRTPLRKPRIMLIEEAMLQEIVDELDSDWEPYYEYPSHQPRWNTLKAMARIYEAESNSIDGRLLRLCRVSWPRQAILDATRK